LDLGRVFKELRNARIVKYVIATRLVESLHFYRTDDHWSKLSRLFRGAVLAGLCAIVALGGCAKSAEQIELNPGAWAPQAAQREWAPAPSQHGLVGSAAEAAVLSDHPPSGERLGLTELIGYALANNPSTRSAWCSAEASAAAAGKARAPYYPIVSAHNARAIVLKQRPPHAFDSSAKAHVRIAEQKDLGIHAGLDPCQKGFAEIRQHVPVSIIDEAHHLFALVGVLTGGDIEVGDVALERSFHIAIIDIQARPVRSRFGGFSACVDITIFCSVR
jgi:hypothetical protein